MRRKRKSPKTKGNVMKMMKVKSKIVMELTRKAWASCLSLETQKTTNL